MPTGSFEPVLRILRFCGRNSQANKDRQGRLRTSAEKLCGGLGRVFAAGCWVGHVVTPTKEVLGHRSHALLPVPLLFFSFLCFFDPPPPKAPSWPVPIRTFPSSMTAIPIPVPLWHQAPRRPSRPPLARLPRPPSARLPRAPPPPTIPPGPRRRRPCSPIRRRRGRIRRGGRRRRRRRRMGIARVPVPVPPPSSARPAVTTLGGSTATSSARFASAARRGSGGSPCWSACFPPRTPSAPAARG